MRFMFPEQNSLRQRALRGAVYACNFAAGVVLILQGKREPRTLRHSDYTGERHPPPRKTLWGSSKPNGRLPSRCGAAPYLTGRSTWSWENTAGQGGSVPTSAAHKTRSGGSDHDLQRRGLETSNWCGTDPYGCPTTALPYCSHRGRSSSPSREISLAHRGLLILDELPSSVQMPQALREPLDQKRVHIARAGYNVNFPADCWIVATANPCPCGYLGSSVRECRCSSGDLARYQRGCGVLFWTALICSASYRRCRRRNFPA